MEISIKREIRIKSATLPGNIDNNVLSARTSIPPRITPTTGKKAIDFPISPGNNVRFTGMGKTVRNPNATDNDFIIGSSMSLPS